MLPSGDSAGNLIDAPIWTNGSFLNTDSKREISNSLGARHSKQEVDNLVGVNVGALKLDDALQALAAIDEQKAKIVELGSLADYRSRKRPRSWASAYRP